MVSYRIRFILDRLVVVNVFKLFGKKIRFYFFDKFFVVEFLKGVGGLGFSLVGGKGVGEEYGGKLEKF